MISRDEILKGQDCPPELEANLNDYLEKINKFRNVYGRPMIVSSGYRSPEHSLAVGGYSDDAHTSCQACDFKDSDSSLKTFCYNNQTLLEQCGLYMEDCHYQPAGDSHVHLQSRPVPSGRHIFIP